MKVPSTSTAVERSVEIKETTSTSEVPLCKTCSKPMILDAKYRERQRWLCYKDQLMFYPLQNFWHKWEDDIVVRSGLSPFIDHSHREIVNTAILGKQPRSANSKSTLSGSSSQQSWKCNKCGFVVFVLPNRPLRLCPKCGVAITLSASETNDKIQPSQKSNIELKDNLVHALNDEIDFIKKEGGTRSYIIRNGEKIGKFSEKTIYRFDFDGDRIETDVPVALQIGESKERIETEIVSIVGQEITLSTSRSLPDNISKAKMFADPIFILEKLRDRIASPSTDFSLALARKLFAEEEPKLGSSSVTVSSKLNKFQKAAVEKSIGSEVFFIWGPPGTGKTTTISSIISHAFQNKKTVLITSNTNVAVDNAIAKAEETIRQTVGYKNGDILRVGIPQAYVPDNVLIEHIAKEKLEKIDAEMKLLEQKNTKLKIELDRQRENLKLIVELDRLTRLEQKSTTEFNEAKTKLDKINQEIEQLQAKLLEANEMSKLSRLIRGIKVEDITNKLTALQNSLSSMDVPLHNKVRTLEDNCLQISSELQTIRDKLTTIGETRESCINAFDVATKTLSDNEHRLSELRNERDNIEKEIIKAARIIGTTLAKTWLRAEIFKHRFDLVVVDEASMATLPMLYFAAGIANERVLIVGDFKQIPAIVQADTEQTKLWLRNNIFDLNGIVGKGASTKSHEMLRIQYRMNPDISKIVSTHVYDGLLTDHPSVKRGSNVDKPPGAGYSLIVIDTTNLNPWCMAREESGSRINLIHAELAILMAKDAIQSGFTKIGIITPYRAQARIIAARVEDEGIRKNVEVATVHRFQGREKQVVIFDVSDSKPFDPSRLISTNRDTEKQSEKLLNVAISRAEDKLILIANIDYLGMELDKNEMLLKILIDCERDGIQLAGEQFLRYPAEDIDIKYEDAGVIATYRAEDFYSAFESDLREARKDIVIVSAFVTERRVKILQETLRDAVEKGVTVRILTKPPEAQEKMEQTAAEGIRILKNLGARVELNPKTHEKLSVIDTAVTWYGSLNILSQNVSSESMMRFVGENTARRLLIDVGFKAENVLKPTEFQELKDGMRNLTVVGKVATMEQVQIRRRKNGSPTRFAHATLEAEGKNCNLTLWEAEIDKVKVDDRIRIINGYTTDYNGRISLQSGKFGKIEVIDTPNKETE